MTERMLKWLAWGIALSAVLLSALTEILVYLNSGPKLGPRLGSIGIVLPFSIVGALIISRLPRHRIGWLFCAAAPGAFQAFAGAFSEYVLAGQAASPVGVWLAWLSSWVAFPAIGLTVLALLLFPTGHLLSPRWSLAIWAGAVGIASVCAGIMFFPGRPPLLASGVTFHNPVGLSGWEGLLTLLLVLGWTMFFGSALAAVASLVLRLRRARGRERQQLKWFVYASAVSITLYFISSVIPASGRDVLAAVAAPLIPVAAGIAILRYHLFDIDILIRRTVIYGALTAILALFYFASVVVLQQLFRGITGQGSELAIILSTLAIAALFNPVRRRVQDAIDRRFYRRKYDAAKVLAAFGATARDEVDLNKLTNELTSVVNETMQPKSVSVWLKKSEREVKR